MTIKNVQKWVSLHVMWPLTSIRNPWTRECEVEIGTWPLTFDWSADGVLWWFGSGAWAGRLILRDLQKGTLWPEISCRTCRTSAWITPGPTRTTPRCSFPPGQRNILNLLTTLPTMLFRKFHQSESICEQIAPKELFSSAHSLSDTLRRLFCSCRTQRNTLWLVDSEGAELEEIVLDREGYCAYSATGTATVTTTTAAVHKPAQPSVCSYMCVCCFREAWCTWTTAAARTSSSCARWACPSTAPSPWRGWAGTWASQRRCGTRRRRGTWASSSTPTPPTYPRIHGDSVSIATPSSQNTYVTVDPSFLEIQKVFLVFTSFLRWLLHWLFLILFFTKFIKIFYKIL